MTTMLCNVIIVSVLLLWTTTVLCQNYVNVTTSLGTVTGLRMINSGIEYYSFRGIPYANVTQRFNAPTPIKSWTSVLMAIDDGPGCIQPKKTQTTIMLTGESEACLFVNVYTPQLPQLSINPKLPVMVFIHGGGFREGAGSSYSYGPEFFMAENNIVLVSINYRLGFFGFLSTGREDAPGNAGLKDQVVALKWIQQEISNFGGDPSRVTLFGESAGAAAVILHMLSPMSKDNDVMYEMFNKNLQERIPSRIRKHLTPDQIQVLVQKLRDFYFNGGKVDKTQLKGFVKLFGDHVFVYPTVETVRKLVEKQNNVYLYNFVYRGKTYKDFWPNPSAAKLNYTGVSHGEELPFLFYSSDRIVQNVTDVNSDDYITMKKLLNCGRHLQEQVYLPSAVQMDQ